MSILKIHQILHFYLPVIIGLFDSLQLTNTGVYGVKKGVRDYLMFVTLNVPFSHFVSYLDIEYNIKPNIFLMLLMPSKWNKKFKSLLLFDINCILTKEGVSPFGSAYF